MTASLTNLLTATADRLRRSAKQACYVPHWQQSAFPFQFD